MQCRPLRRAHIQNAMRSATTRNVVRYNMEYGPLQLESGPLQRAMWSAATCNEVRYNAFYIAFTVERLACVRLRGIVSARHCGRACVHAGMSTSVCARVPTFRPRQGECARVRAIGCVSVCGCVCVLCWQPCCGSVSECVRADGLIEPNRAPVQDAATAVVGRVRRSVAETCRPSRLPTASACDACRRPTAFYRAAHLPRHDRPQPPPRGSSSTHGRNGATEPTRGEPSHRNAPRAGALLAPPRPGRRPAHLRGVC
jgi:hypothetical protein